MAKKAARRRNRKRKTRKRRRCAKGRLLNRTPRTGNRVCRLRRYNGRIFKTTSKKAKTDFTPQEPPNVTKEDVKKEVDSTTVTKKISRSLRDFIERGTVYDNSTCVFKYGLNGVETDRCIYEVAFLDYEMMQDYLSYARAIGVGMGLTSDAQFWASPEDMQKFYITGSLGNWLKTKIEYEVGSINNADPVARATVLDLASLAEDAENARKEREREDPNSRPT